MIFKNDSRPKARNETLVYDTSVTMDEDVIRVMKNVKVIKVIQISRLQSTDVLSLQINTQILSLESKLKTSLKTGGLLL